MHSLLSLFVPAALLFSGPSDGPAREGKRGEKILRLDADGSGTLSASEVEGTRLADHFTTIDANGDGELTREEIRDAFRARRAERFAQMDANDDGVLTADEVSDTPLAKHFSRIDADSDGRLTPDELRAAHQGHKGEHGKRKRGKRKRGKGKRGIR